jgi:hypothetical protein
VQVDVDYVRDEDGCSLTTAFSIGLAFSDDVVGEDVLGFLRRSSAVRRADASADAESSIVLDDPVAVGLGCAPVRRLEPEARPFGFDRHSARILSISPRVV